MNRLARLLVLLSMVLAFHGACLANELYGRIVGILDGDTIDVLTDSKELVRVRLAGIDAPEKRQAFGQVAKQALSGLVHHQRATVEWSKRDRYGRVVGKVLVSGADVNLQMVQRGLAWHYKAYHNEQPLDDRFMYARAEDAARASRTGLWSQKSPIAPWEFRREARAPSDARFAHRSMSAPRQSRSSSMY